MLHLGKEIDLIDNRVMKRILRIVVALLGSVVATACGPDSGDVLEKEEPIIVAQTYTSGTIDVAVDPQSIYVVFDREVRLANESAVRFIPEVAKEVSVDGTLLTIKTVEAMEYECNYVLSIGSGAVVDVLTGGENRKRDITFRTINAPYTPPTSPATMLANGGASQEAYNLYNYLWAMYGTKTLSSASINEYLNINECEWIKKWTGEYPAILNVDYKYLNISPSQQLNYATIEGTVADWWAANGIVSACWHWLVPTAEGSKAYTYEGAKTTLKVSNMLIEGTWENAAMMDALAEMASLLKVYQKQGIPIIWRPLHEASGNNNSAQASGKPVFWWGYEGAEVYKKLWQKVFLYFQSEGLDNLIWVWHTQLEDIDYFPGDKYVDMIACDVYDALSPTKALGIWRKASEQFPHRMVSLCEMGRMCSMTAQMDSGIMWSYFMPWYDNNNNLTEGFYHQNATIQWWRTAFEDSRVLSREDLPSLK